MKSCEFGNLVRRFVKVSVFLAVSMALNTWAGAKTESGKPLPPFLIGTWVVTRVNIDNGATRKLNYQFNDPRLKGRVFTITVNNLTENTPENLTCINPTLTSKKMTAGELIKNSMGGRGVDPEIPVPKDFDLPMSEKTVVNVLNIGCTDGLWGNGAGRTDAIDNTWIIALPKNQLALRWFDETVLILSRLPVNEKPKPSFNCSKAITPTEKAICGSVELASFDLSVAESYKQNIKGFTEGKDPSAIKRVKTCQKAWIKKRDACGSNVACLKKTMEEQLEVLGDLEKFNNPE